MPVINMHDGVPPGDAMTAAGAPSQREAAKTGRRRRIIDSTCDLLRECGLDGVSGKLIAARAGVSLSTVYNLFGSKDAVLVAVYDEDLARYEARIAALPCADAVARLFESVDIAAALYDEDPAFYRAIMRRRPPGEPLDAALRRPRADFWVTLVQRAIDTGQLRAGTDAGAVGLLLILLFSGALADWVAGDIGVERFRIEVGFGFATVLLPFAADGAQPALRDRMERLHDAVRVPGPTNKTSARLG